MAVFESRLPVFCGQLRSGLANKSFLVFCDQILIPISSSIWAQKRNGSKLRLKFQKANGFGAEPSVSDIQRLRLKWSATIRGCWFATRSSSLERWTKTRSVQDRRNKCFTCWHVITEKKRQRRQCGECAESDRDSWATEDSQSVSETSGRRKTCSTRKWKLSASNIEKLTSIF